jgi:uncharacterized protein with GYD domain
LEPGARANPIARELCRSGGGCNGADGANETLRIRRQAARMSRSSRPIPEVALCRSTCGRVSYTKAGVRGVAKEGASSRRDAVEHAIESLGGEVEAVYFAFGEADVYVIGELPDNESAAALSLAANVSEGLTAETVVLMTPEEFDAATRKEVSFRPPGR